MAEKYRFSINTMPRYGDEFRATGVVYDLTYFTWAREAGGTYLRNLNADTEVPANIYSATVRMEAECTTPLLMTEEAKVSVRTTRIGRSSTTTKAQIDEAVSGRAVATITSVAVFVDAQTGRSVPLPDEYKQKIISFEGRENVEVWGY